MTTPTPHNNNKDTKPANGSMGKPPAVDTKASDGTRPVDEKPADEKPAETTAAAPATSTTSLATTATPTPPAPSTTAATAADKKARTGRKVYIVVGAINEFTNTAEAEKFLNGAPHMGEFTVIRGNKVEKKQKISLR